jgi:formylglycine-generating enzyme required for sulfatase activity
MHRLAIGLVLLAAITTVALPAAAQQPAPRVALVIGNESYPDAGAPLTSIKDARALAAELRQQKFQTILAENVGRADMRARLDEFAAKIAPGTVALFYFSGFGLQAAKRTYLLPTNAAIWNEPDVERSGIRLEEVLAEMHRKGAGVKIVIIDASRRNPYERRLRQVAEGLAAIGIPENTLIMYSAAPDKRLSDSSAAASLFTQELLKELRVPNATAEEMFNRVRLGVSEASRREQIPWVSSSLVTPFAFGSSGPLVLPKPEPPPPVSSNPRPPSDAWSPEPAPGQSAEAPLAPERERALKPGDEFKECAECPRMVVIPAGEFMMGAPESEPEHYPNELPQHRVNIAQPFAVGAFKVTRDELDAFVRDTRYRIDKCFTLEDGRVEERLGRSPQNPGFAQDGKHPAVCVSWDDAQAYVAWLTRKTGRVYRLLTEAEWEYAARAGTSSPFWWGTSISADQANYDSSSSYGGSGNKREGREKTVPVDSFAANPWGLYQVHGNAFEWVEDCWNDTYGNAPADGAARLTGDCSRHVRRGSAWNYIAATLRSAFRDSRPARFRGSNIGLRVARMINQ